MEFGPHPQTKIKSKPNIFLYQKAMSKEHLSGTCLEAVRASLAISCSMQKQQQSHMDQAQFGLVAPASK